MQQNKDKKPYPQPVNIPVQGGNYQLTKSFEYLWKSKSGAWNRIIVPRGFTYDGASIPRAFWSILGVGKDGVHRAAATLHDWIYQNKGRLGSSYQRMYANGRFPKRWVSIGAIWTQKDADKLLLISMKDAGVPFIRRQLIYRAVRLFGWKAWNQKR